MEVFIRPSGYFTLIRSEKAYLPSTVRYLSTFHLITETISLIFFIPEFRCLFGSKSCSDAYPFSLANACLMSLYGPDRRQAFYGLAFITILRLRIFGLVRHWTNMWINNTFVRVRVKDGEWRVQRGKGFFAPQKHKILHGEDTVVPMNERMSHEISLRKKAGAIVSKEQKTELTQDDHITNATKIGTALLITNAKRSLIFV